MDSRVGSGSSTSSQPTAGTPAVAGDNLPPEFFLTDGTSTLGPFTPTELRRKLDAGEITMQSLVCKQGWPAWKPIAGMAELCPPSVSVVAPHPPSSTQAAKPKWRYFIPQSSEGRKLLLAVVFVLFTAFLIADSLTSAASAAWVFLMSIYLPSRIFFVLVSDGVQAIKRRWSGPPLKVGAVQLVPATDRTPLHSDPKELFLNVAGASAGPYSLDEIRIKLSSGRISTADYVWKAGWMGWRKITDLPELQRPVPSQSQPAASPTIVVSVPAPSPTLNAGSSSGGRWTALFPASGNSAIPLRRGFIACSVMVTTLAALYFVVPWLYSQWKSANEAKDPIMAERTAEVWRQVQAMEVSAGNASDPQTRLLRLAQLDLNRVDPKLVAHVAKAAELSKGWSSVLASLQADLQAKQAANAKTGEALAAFGAVLGVLAGGQTRTLDELGRNLSVGRQAGELAGQIGNALDGLNADRQIEAKYRGQLEAYQRAFSELSQERNALGKHLAQKYRRPFLSFQ